LGGRVQGLELRSSAPGGELIHLKGYCVDHRLLRTGSANFSCSGETRQDNDLVALRGVSVCAGFEVNSIGLGHELRRLAVLYAFLPLCGVGVVCASWIGSESGAIVPPPEA
jgi:hypothetical protein